MAMRHQMQSPAYPLKLAEASIERCTSPGISPTWSGPMRTFIDTCGLASSSFRFQSTFSSDWPSPGRHRSSLCRSRGARRAAGAENDLGDPNAGRAEILNCIGITPETMWGRCYQMAGRWPRASRRTRASLCEPFLCISQGVGCPHTSRVRYLGSSLQ